MTPSPFAVLIFISYAAALAVAWHVGDGARWRERLSDRLWLGVPWGTLITIAFVLAVYLFVQGGLERWRDPVVVPFRAWSYLYPTGILTAGFSHSSSNHLIGNLVATAALAPIAEYAWGHYPGGRRRSATEKSATSTSEPLGGSTGVRDRLDEAIRTPWVRAFVWFPLAVVLAGLFTALFAVGPVIGFSGVVFAFGGFALVRYPISTLIALLVSSVLSVTYYAMRYPVVRSEISGSAPSPPWWATIAVQGHALGIVLGVVLGLLLLRHRGERPDVGRVFLAMLVYGMTRELWALYWFDGNGVYVLYRGLGVSLVVALALLVAVAAAASDRPIPETIADLPRSPTPVQFAAAWLAFLGALFLGSIAAVLLFEWPLQTTTLATGIAAVVLALPAIWTLSPIELDEVPSARQLTFGALLALLILVAVPAMLPNLVTVGHDPVPNEESITVEGYSITYAEDVRNRMIPAVDLPAVANRTSVPTSGVIVVNEERHIWTTALSKQYLKSEGHGTVTVGGVGWRETIYVDRTGWTVTGNDTAYVIDLSHDGERVRAFTSPPSRASPVIANHTVAVVPTQGRFELHVYRNATNVGNTSGTGNGTGTENATNVASATSVGNTTLPAIGNSTSVGPITFHTGQSENLVTIFASANGTRVPIAQREAYREN